MRALLLIAVFPVAVSMCGVGGFLRPMTLVECAFQRLGKTVRAINCYVCDSTRESRCEDPFNNPQDLLVLCPELSPCVKKYFEGGVERCCHCRGNDTSPGCCGQHGPGRRVTIVRFCVSPWCNGASMNENTTADGVSS